MNKEKKRDAFRWSHKTSINLLTVFSVLVSTSSIAHSFEFPSNKFNDIFNAELTRLGQDWRIEQHDCEYHEDISSFVCRYTDSNNIELDVLSKDVSAKSYEIVMIWNGYSAHVDDFAYTLRIVGQLCSPNATDNELKSKMAAILPKSSEATKDAADVPQRRFELGQVEYAVRLMPNKFLMVTLKDKKQ